MNRSLLLIICSILIAQPPSPQTLEGLKQKAIKNNKRQQKNKAFELELRQAQTLENNGMPDDAEKIYRNVLNKEPGYTRAFSKNSDKS